MMAIKQRADLTFKDNRGRGRHGWIRLTPAYSVNLVRQILEAKPDVTYLLDPFAGTGTTGLVAGQRGLRCDLFDINPFLVWLATVKNANYSEEHLAEVRQGAPAIVAIARRFTAEADLWFPPISHIERWWLPNRLMTLGKIFNALNQVFPTDSPAKNLLLIVFCRLIIEWSNAAFNHQSMSFQPSNHTQGNDREDEPILGQLLAEAKEVIAAAQESVPGQTRALLLDSRDLSAVGGQNYDCVISSPPYANRMSYIRELRPYMFWLGYLENAHAAGELDWQAIGGTWGIATSRLQNWQTDIEAEIIPGLRPIIRAISGKSLLLAHYVHKYFIDMSKHFAGLYNVVRPGAGIFYIIGNSKFYDTLVPTERIYADLMEEYGFIDAQIRPIRKRNSKKELLEFIVSARKPT